MALVQSAASEGHLLGILPDSQSVLCVPITYGDSMLGVLNVESRRENAFAPQDVLILRTLADLLAKLGKHSVSKGCLYIKRLSDVDMPTLKKLIGASVKRKKK